MIGWISRRREGYVLHFSEPKWFGTVWSREFGGVENIGIRICDLAARQIAPDLKVGELQEINFSLGDTYVWED